MVHLRPKFLNLGLAIPLFDFLVSWSCCTPRKEEATVTNTHNLSCGVNVILLIPPQTIMMVDKNNGLRYHFIRIKIARF